MSLPLLTAVTPRYEAELTTRLGSSRAVHVVRRCVDLAELLGAAAAGVGQVAVVSAELRGLDRAALHELSARGLIVLGVHRPGDQGAQRRLQRWGAGKVLPADADQAELDAALSELIEAGPPVTADRAEGLGQPAGKPSVGRPTWPVDPDDGGEPTGAGPTDPADRHTSQGQHAATASTRDRSPGPEGRIVVVWGPAGAPGRSTVAVNTAAELAEPDEPVLLVDLDTYGASVAQLLAVLDEAPGVAAATRAADAGTLDPTALTRLAPEVAPGLRVLTGMPRSDRWPELREHAIQDVLATCAQTVPLTVVDVGFCVEADEELSFDTAAPRRNGATLAALEAADQVVVVGAADPVSLQRLVRGLDQLAELVHAPLTIVVNRLRSSAVGKDPGRRVQQALERFAGVTDVVLISADQDGLDAAVLAGRTLREARPGSPARVGVRELAGRISNRGPAERRRDRRARRRAGV